MHLVCDRKQVVCHLQSGLKEKLQNERKMQKQQTTNNVEKDKTQKRQSEKMQREKGRVRLRRRIRRNVGAISRSKVEASTMAGR